jgi:hypothetical protein
MHLAKFAVEHEWSSARSFKPVRAGSLPVNGAKFGSVAKTGKRQPLKLVNGSSILPGPTRIFPDGEMVSRVAVNHLLNVRIVLWEPWPRGVRCTGRLIPCDSSR